MARGGFLAAGAVAYLIFFATFLYLIGFTADLPLLSRTVDRGPVSAPVIAAVIDLALIALFGLQHSVMARPAFKARWTRIVPPALERSVYVLLASLLLIVLMAFWHPLPRPVWTVTRPILAATLWALFAAGWLLVLLSTFLINHFELFGLQQVWLHGRGRQAAAPRFRTPLFYRLMRHPLYSGFILAFWATPRMTAGHLLLAGGLTLYILIAIRHEERDLTDLFGDDYRRYRRTTGMLIPGIGRAR
jgi:methanethiol S-methyltransferase